MKYEYWKSSKNNMWYWHLRAANNKIIAVGGEGYHNKADVISAIKLVKGSGGAPENNLTPDQ